MVSTEILARFKRQPTFKPPKLFAESVYEWILLGEETPTPPSDQDPADIGLSYILQQLNIQPDEFTKRTNFTDRFGVTHLYGIPLHEGSLIENLHAAAHIKSAPTPEVNESRISSEEAVNAAVDCLKVPFYPDIAPVKESYKTENGNILVWKLQLRDNPLTRWIEVKVNANTGNNALVKFKRGKKLKTTAMGMFDGAFDPTLPPQTPKNLVTGAINAFYAANMVHDVLYPYGFNEPAGNFQKDNFKRSGMGGDPVIINLQSSKEKNHVSFDTPPDGQPGVLNLHISTTTNPNRDSALDNTVMIHELAHGLSSRLTGGAQTKMCMSKIESRGLSEGYSDVMAPVFTAKPEDTRNTKKQLLSTSIAHLVVECEQVTGHRIQSGLVPAIQKSRLRLLGRALDPGVENVYTWLRGGVLNGEADLDQRWLDGTVEHESMGTRHDNQGAGSTG
ncbi:hypothetical protein BASA81_016810 [Batrachochytrium salamandrivorans]|nr:hypothetical protein BASA81_016810 [Batrachochytrium salamandrivorans]